MRPKLSTIQKILAAIVCAGVILVIGVNMFKDSRQIVESPRDETPKHQKMLSEANPIELMAYASELEVKKAGDLPGQINLINKQLEVGKRIEELELRNQGSLSSPTKLARIGLTAKLIGLHHQYNLGTIDDESMQYVIEQLKSSDPNVSNLANLTISFACVSRYL